MFILFIRLAIRDYNCCILGPRIRATVTRNVLNRNEFRAFWIMWRDGHIQVRLIKCSKVQFCTRKQSQFYLVALTAKYNVGHVSGSLLSGKL